MNIEASAFSRFVTALLCLLALHYIYALNLTIILTLSKLAVYK